MTDGMQAGGEAAVAGPHDHEAPLVAGVPLDQAQIALVLVHGRGGTADGMLPIARAAKATDAALVAPRAAGNSWYPDRFLAPRARNEPWLGSALASVGRAVAQVEAAGIPRERIVLVGFSQGACLTLDWVAGQAVQGARFGGVAALAGALVGDDAEARVHAGTLNGTPVLLACGDADAHIPEARVRDAARVFTTLGAAVDLRVYPGVGHDIVADEISALTDIVAQLRG
jgi:phospholipase/carboxylesterase